MTFTFLLCIIERNNTQSMIAKTTIKGIIGRDYTLMDLVSFFKKNSTAEGYEITIDSVGGLVDEGFAMYDLIKKEAKRKPITTIAKEVMSIATVIFLAADKRLASKKSVFMIHTPMAVFTNNGELVFTKYDFKELSAELEVEEKRIISCYKAVTGIDEETLSKLLRADNYFTGIEAYDLGFVTDLKNVETYAILKEKNMSLASIFKKVLNMEEELPIVEETKEETEVVSETPELNQLTDVIEKVKTLEELLVKAMETIAGLESRLNELEARVPAVVESPEEIEAKLEAKLETAKQEVLAKAKTEYQKDLTDLAKVVDAYSKITKTNGSKLLPQTVALETSSKDVVNKTEKSFFDYGTLKDSQ